MTDTRQTATEDSPDAADGEDQIGSPAAVGFVGLGSIGRPMVESLLRAGVPTVVNDLNRAVVDEVVALGAVAAATLAELAAATTVVGVCVPADAHVRAVLDGPDGLFAHLADGSTVAVHSTVRPETIRWAADAGRAHGITMVEAALTGGFMAAAEGRSTVLLGGDPADMAPLEPLLQACAAARIHAGDLGSASRLKLCLNLQTYVSFLGVFEAASLAKELGLGLEPLKAAMAANGQLNEMVDGYLILHHLGADDLAGMQDALAGYAAIIEKDLDLIAELADDAGLAIPAAELARARAGTVYFRRGDHP